MVPENASFVGLVSSAVVYVLTGVIVEYITRDVAKCTGLLNETFFSSVLMRG